MGRAKSPHTSGANSHRSSTSAMGANGGGAAGDGEEVKRGWLHRRVGMIPGLAYLLYVPGGPTGVGHRNLWACGIFVLASLTDFLDGWLARRWQLSSPFGAFIDPVADKLMVATVLVLLSGSFSSHLGHWGYVEVASALTISREIGISALREWMAEKGLRANVKVGTMGKWKTTFQMAAITGLLLALPPAPALILGVPAVQVYTTSVVLLWLSTMLAIISGLSYMRAAWPSLSS